MALVALVWGLKSVKAVSILPTRTPQCPLILLPLQEDAKHTLYFAHLFFADHVLSTSWTVFFAVMWWVYTPHDGRRQAHSEAQEEMMKAAPLGTAPMTDEERTRAATMIWNQEKGTALAIIIISWLTKVCPIESYSYTSLSSGIPCVLARRFISPFSSTPMLHISEKALTAPFHYLVPPRHPLPPLTTPFPKRKTKKSKTFIVSLCAPPDPPYPVLQISSGHPNAPTQNRISPCQTPWSGSCQSWILIWKRTRCCSMKMSWGIRVRGVIRNWERERVRVRVRRKVLV